MRVGPPPAVLPMMFFIASGLSHAVRAVHGMSLREQPHTTATTTTTSSCSCSNGTVDPLPFTPCALHTPQPATSSGWQQQQQQQQQQQHDGTVISTRAKTSTVHATRYTLQPNRVPTSASASDQFRLAASHANLNAAPSPPLEQRHAGNERAEGLKPIGPTRKETEGSAFPHKREALRVAENLRHSPTDRLPPARPGYVAERILFRYQ